MNLPYASLLILTLGTCCATAARGYLRYMFRPARPGSELHEVPIVNGTVFGKISCSSVITDATENFLLTTANFDYNSPFCVLGLTLEFTATGQKMVLSPGVVAQTSKMAMKILSLYAGPKSLIVIGSLNEKITLEWGIFKGQVQISTPEKYTLKHLSVMDHNGVVVDATPFHMNITHSIHISQAVKSDSKRVKRDRIGPAKEPETLNIEMPEEDMTPEELTKILEKLQGSRTNVEITWPGYEKSDTTTASTTTLTTRVSKVVKGDNIAKPIYSRALCTRNMYVLFQKKCLLQVLVACANGKYQDRPFGKAGVDETNHLTDVQYRETSQMEPLSCRPEHDQELQCPSPCTVPEFAAEKVTKNWIEKKTTLPPKFIPAETANDNSGTRRTAMKTTKSTTEESSTQATVTRKLKRLARRPTTTSFINN